jgi:adenylylsulfate kinase-like enzyme
MVIWFIGKSAAGKTYIGRKLYDALSVNYANIVFLDGDQLRNAISKDLGHSKEERYISEERRSRLSKLISNQGVHVIVSGISNEPGIREWNKKNIKDYLEIYIKTDQKILYSRDPKDIYKNYLDGKTKNVVGEDIPFQEPIEPWMTIHNNESDSSNEITEKIMFKLIQMNIIQ